MPELHEVISAAMDGQDHSPEPEAESSGGAGVGEQSSGIAETDPPSGQEQAEGEFLGEAFDWRSVPQELIPLAKGLQGSYTRKQQALAEQQKALEALQYRDAWRNAEQLITEDPARAAAWFRQQAEWLEGDSAGQRADTDPYADLTPATDVEERLLAQIKALEQQQKQLLDWQEQQQVATVQQQIAREFSDLEKAVGRAIPEQERHQIAAFCVQNQIPNVSFGYRAMRYDADLQAARQRGVNEGAVTLQQKQSMAAPPSAMVSRASSAADGPKDLWSIASAAYDELAND